MGTQETLVPSPFLSKVQYLLPGDRNPRVIRSTYLYGVSHESYLSMRRDCIVRTSPRHSSDVLQVLSAVWMIMAYLAGRVILGQWVSLASQADRGTMSGQAVWGPKI